MGSVSGFLRVLWDFVARILGSGAEVAPNTNQNLTVGNTQTGGSGGYNPQIQGVQKIETKGDFNMGPNIKHGNTSFNQTGDGNQQFQGDNHGSNNYYSGTRG